MEKGRSNRTNNEKYKKVFLYALGISAAGGAAYLTFDYLKKKKMQSQELPEDTTDTIVINNNLPASSSSHNSVVSKASANGDNFPLKRGSVGSRVTMLQQALAKLIGQSVMDANGGIDGQFGPGTANALKIAGFTNIVSESTFKAILSSAGVTTSFLQVSFEPKELATNLYRAAQGKNIGTVLANLRQIKSSSEYSQVNQYYKSIPIISKTIVNDLLSYAFASDESAKGQIKEEFLRIGLKVDSSGQWSLQGIGLYKDLITLRETFVTDMQNNRMPVNKNTILGTEIKTANGMTWFRSVDNSLLQVPTQDVKYT